MSVLILVSNDDGVESPGIKCLAKHLKKIPQAKIVVVAPDRERSAASHALTLHRPLRIEKLSKDRYAVDGTPTDSVMLGVHSILDRKPDLVVSGINKGGNVGEDVHYSGTVSAAVEGAIMGVPAIAMSMVGNDQPFKFEEAGDFARKLSLKVLKKGLPRGVVLNVNVPNIEKNEIQGTTVSKLGKHNYGDVIVQNIDPRGKPYYWIGGDPYNFDPMKGTDTRACLDNKISVTPIKVDMTDRKFMSELKSWKL